MTPVLATVDEVLARLGEDAERGLVLSYLTSAETLFLAACGRPDRPFQGSEVDRLEVHDGNGRPYLWLDYPIETLTSLTIGRNVTAFDETLAVDDAGVISFRAGSRRLVRVDGGVFGCRNDPNAVRVTYTTADEVTNSASEAVIAGTLFLLRRRGAEDQSSERVGGYSADLITSLDRDPTWHQGVMDHREVAIA